MPTALITHPACLRHDTGPYHPECPDRLRAVLAALETPGVRRPAARVGPARHHRAAHPRASGELRRGDPVDPSRRGRDGAARRRHRDERRQRRGRAARRRCRGGGRRCGDGRLGARRLRRGAPARPPRRTRASDGLLPVQQRRGGGAARARPLGRAARRGGGLRRAPRQRHPGDVRRRQGPVLRLVAPAPVLSRHRRGLGTRHRQQHRQRAAAAGLGRRRVPRRLVGHDPAGARPFRARPADRLGRASTRTRPTRWRSFAWRPPTTPGSPRSCCASPRRIAAAGSSRCWRAATTSTRSPPRPRRMCAR